MQTTTVLTDKDFAGLADPDARHVAAVEDEDLAVRDESAARCVLRMQLGVDVAQVTAAQHSRCKKRGPARSDAYKCSLLREQTEVAVKGGSPARTDACEYKLVQAVVSDHMLVSWHSEML